MNTNNKKLIENLNQKIYYISFSKKRIGEIIDVLEKTNASLIPEILYKKKNTKLADYHKIVGVLLIAGIDKIGQKAIRGMKENEFRESLANIYDKDKKIQEALSSEKISKSDIVASESETVFDATRLMKEGFDLSKLNQSN